MKNLILLSFVTIFLCACGKDKDQEKITGLETEVLAIHDEVMPKQEEIMSLKSQLSKKIQDIDSLQNVGVSSNTMAEQRIKAVDLNQKLLDADKLMMDWMHEYRGDSAKKLDPKQSILYFEGEREKILLVKQATLKSIQEAKTFLE
ncbi:viral A-type inclusion protein [Dyadobacter sp. CY261]|uniref:viral A-type inclusion protein n=1 Tax=Dyadobacter sp. CY261 TaxID=2907203 RepID=UPI001F1A4E48|nr:viral A-type inclusion protein [Dyadobacter sp. CY261]MCF0075062.1 viral A-type inclusion protein [Dyadobacter sp. CY261]